MRKSWAAPYFVFGFSISLVWLESLGGQIRSQVTSSGATFGSAVQPFLARDCVGCHNEKLSSANLNLSAFTDESSAAKKPELWDKVRDKLITGKMPPPVLPAPAKEDIAAVTKWIDGMLKTSGYAADNPGRVMARRLNRVEYNNTIRDLLAV